MRRIARLLVSLLLVSSAAAWSAPQRTFVASTGADGNPCSLGAPCRSFGVAVTAVAAGGEVVVLDSAGYGAVTIGKSVSLIAPPGVHAGVSVFAGTGITVDGSGVVVVLRGLSLNNQGGSDGIDFVQGASLHVEGCVLSGFTTGILVSAAGSATHVLDSIVREGYAGIVFNGTDATGRVSRTRVERNSNEGIEIIAQGTVSIEDSVVSGSAYNIDLYPIVAGAVARVTVARTLVGGGVWGIFAEPNAASSEAHVTAMDSTISGNLSGGIGAASSGTKSAIATSVRNQLLDNGTALLSTGPNSTLIAEGNAIARNGTGVSQLGGGVVLTRGTSSVAGNGSDTVGTPFTYLSGI